MIKQRLAIFIFILGLSLPLSYVSAGTVLSSYKYAWSNNAGYINFASTTVSDNALSGYAWSANSGWIKLDPVQGGVLNDGTGNLSGSAWGESFGWIDFDGVSINGSTGRFSGTATGALVGTITFDCSYCDVRTDWQQATTPTVVSSGGGGGSISLLPSASTTSVVSPPPDSKLAFIKAVANTIPNLKYLTTQPVLSLGATSENIKTLQIFLNALGFTVAKSGPGSPGNETTVFGPATKVALTKFQVEYGITPATGYLGPQTRAFIATIVGVSSNTTAPYRQNQAPVTGQGGAQPASNTTAVSKPADVIAPVVAGSSSKSIFSSIGARVAHGFDYVWTPVRQAVRAIFSWFGIKL